MKNYMSKKDLNEMANLFMNWNLDDCVNDSIKDKNIELSKYNDELKIENKRLIAEINRLKNKLEKKETPYDEIRRNIEKNYTYISSEGIKTLSTAEYLYENERGNLDYASIYLQYVKVIEMELKDRLGIGDRYTFGNLLNKLESYDVFRTFIKRIKEERILEVRNRAAHLSPITRNECGKIRKLLLEDRWLNNLLMMFDGMEITKNEEVEIDSYIYKTIGYERYNGVLYNCYEGEVGYILSDKRMSENRVVGKGKIVYIKGIEYILV